MKKYFVIFIMFLSSVCIGQALELPSIFSDNMVVQQNGKMVVWGWSSPGSTVKVVAGWNPNDTIVCQTNNMSEFSVELPTAKADGKSYTLTIMGAGKKEIHNVKLGEVWLCSGQSNMEWTYNHGGLKDREKEVEDSDIKDISIFTVPRIGSSIPQDNVNSKWEVCSKETMPSCSAVAYFFAKKLQKELLVPVGIVVSAWGGTSAEVWVPEREIKNNAVLSEAQKLISDKPWWPSLSGVCYNKMIHPLLKYRFNGVIWYQGESNVDNCDTYSLLMKTMVDSWRVNFGSKLPFLYVQIAPHSGYDNNKAAVLREQQGELRNKVSDSHMIVISDLVDDVNNIHPSNKMDVGSRLAETALYNYYNKNEVRCLYPQINSIEPIGKNKLLLKFNNTYETLIVKGDKIIGLKIFGDNATAYITNFKITKEGLIITYKGIEDVVKRVEYCYDAASIGNIFNSHLLPLEPFGFTLK